MIQYTSDGGAVVKSSGLFGMRRATALTLAVLSVSILIPPSFAAAPTDAPASSTEQTEIAATAPAAEDAPKPDENPGPLAGTTQPTDVVGEKYPVPYKVPTQAELTTTLTAIRKRIEATSIPRVFNKKTNKEITDLSTPNTDLVIEPGDRSMFKPASYPVGVIHHGMLLAAEATGDKKFSDYTAKWFKLFADDLPQFAKWPRRNNPLLGLLYPNSLDACGAIGGAMAKAAIAKIGPDLRPRIDQYADYILTKQFRLEDGTLARRRPFPQSVWADDMYMGVSFLSAMGKLTGDNRYYNDAVLQIMRMSTHLFQPAQGLYTHGWESSNPDTHPRIFWGRANGWCMMAMVELLDVLPDDHPGKPEIIKQLKLHAQGIASLQAGNGMWHQMLDRTDSYTETSCTAMFTFAMARAARKGWLDPAVYGPVAIAGWDGLATHISSDGHIDGTCIGTTFAADYIYYYNRPNIDDVHAYGPTLLAGAEILKLVTDNHLRVTKMKNSPVTVRAWPTGRRPTTEAYDGEATTMPSDDATARPSRRSRSGE